MKTSKGIQESNPLSSPPPFAFNVAPSRIPLGQGVPLKTHPSQSKYIFEKPLRRNELDGEIIEVVKSSIVVKCSKKCNHSSARNEELFFFLYESH